ncbi:MAG: hypothetical protein A2Y25_07145 [Candidatus Melainabacteria bacterium GWF2_37_15]|nr:MAG: hypothetical protein A2Y25_07145 [Candidatus Melainabacteria bacterium GWF2_37_15]
MIGNIAGQQYFQPFLPNKQVVFKGIKTSESYLPNKDEIVINGIIIPKSNFNRFNKKEFQFFDDIRFLAPLSIKEGLIKLARLKDDLCNNSYECNSTYHKDMLKLIGDFSQVVEEEPRLKERKLTGIIDGGARTMVLNIGENPETGEAEVLKISDRPNHPKALGRRFEPSFDMPIGISDQKRGFYYYTQPKAETDGITMSHLEEVIKKIKKADYRTAKDLELIDTFKKQIGLYKGQPYLIDPECAVKTT